jgi:hypothetical protein
LRENGTWRNSVETRGRLANLLKAINDGRYPNATIEEQRVECADPHDFANEGRCPRLEITLLKKHDRGAPSEFDGRQNSEERVRERPDIRGPGYALISVLVEDLTGLWLREQRRGPYTSKGDGCSATNPPRSVYAPLQDTRPLSVLINRVDSR